MQQIPKNTHPRSLWMVWATCLINLYPACWRERYADEMLAILEEHPPTFWTFGDLLLSLFDAHLHSNMVSGKIFNMLKQFYSSVTTIFSAGLLFCLTVSAIQIELNAIAHNLPTHGVPIPPFFQAILLVLNFLFSTLVTLVVLCGGSLLVSAAWQAIKTRHIRSFFLYLFGILCPVIAFIANSEVNMFSFMYTYRLGLFFSPSGATSPNQLVVVLLSILSLLIFCLIVGVGVWAWRAALRQAISGVRMTNFLFVLTTMTSVILLAYSSCLLFLVGYSFSSGFGTYIVLLSSARTRGLLSVSILLVLYSLVRVHQARRTLAVQTQ